MFATPARGKRLWMLFGLACSAAALYGCGQRGALYMPDRNARVVMRPADASAPNSAPTSAPSAAPGR